MLKSSHSKGLLAVCQGKGGGGGEEGGVNIQMTISSLSNIIAQDCEKGVKMAVNLFRVPMIINVNTHRKACRCVYNIFFHPKDYPVLTSELECE